MYLFSVKGTHGRIEIVPQNPPKEKTKKKRTVDREPIRITERETTRRTREEPGYLSTFQNQNCCSRTPSRLSSLSRLDARSDSTMKLVGPAFPRALLALALILPSPTAASAPIGQVDSSHEQRQVADDAAEYYHSSVSKRNGGGLLSSAKESRALSARRTESDLGTAREDPPPSRRAFVTLLYSDFIHGTRALGQSLRETGTTADTVVLVTPDVRRDTRERLAEDGWM